MVATKERPQTVDVVAILRKQNYYQRMGLNSNEHPHAEICRGYQSRMLMLENCSGKLSSKQTDAAKSLVEDAFRVLSQPTLRRKYDEHLTFIQEQDGESSAVSGFVLDRYRCNGVIAKGNRTVILSAYDERLKCDVVIKCPRDQGDQSLEQKQATRDEAVLFAGFNTGHLVKILDYDVASGAIILERMRSDVSKLLKNRGCDVQLVHGLLEDSLRGLASLHTKGIAHGRIQAEHLLIDDFGGVKLSLTPGMTGVATAIHPDETVRHLAPELLNPKLFGEPSLGIDLYALGVVAIELLCGKRFARQVSRKLGGQSSIENWRLWHSSPTDHLPAVQTLLPNCPPDLCQLLQKMTSKQQHERFADAMECLAALNKQVGAETRSEPLEETREETDAVNVLGSPPALHPEYITPNPISWRSIVRNPKLLFQADAQTHLIGLTTGSLLVLGMILILLQRPTRQEVIPKQLPPSEPEFVWPAATVDTLVNDTPAANSESDRRKVTLVVTPDGSVLEVSGARSDDMSTWELSSGSYVAKCRSEHRDGPVDIPFEVPRGQSDLVIHLTVPPEPPKLADAIPKVVTPSIIAKAEPEIDPKISLPNLETKKDSDDPYADVRNIQYFPTVAAFPICGDLPNRLARDQYEFLHSRFDQLAVDPQQVKKRYFIQLGNDAIDPRASFLVAIQAYLLGEPSYAIQCCRKSLKDAEHFRIPFLLPLRLLTYIQSQSGRPGLAIAECRKVIHWVSRESNGDSTDSFYLAAEEAVWYLGNVVGYIQEAASPQLMTTIDVRFATESAKRLLKPEQWKKFRLARRDVYDRHRSLVRRWRTIRQIDSTEGDSDLEDSSSSGSSPWSYGSEISDSWRSAASALSPLRYSSYQPCDISNLAIEAATSLRMPPSLKYATR